MFQKIKKRDGRVVKFKAEKITKAIANAGLATGEFSEKVAKKLTLQVLNLAQQAINHKIPSVEEIQDVVEEVLLSSPYRKTAKAYILYREQHARLRELGDKISVDLVEQYLSRRDWQVKENSNMTFSLQGLNNYLASEVSKIYWLRKIYPPEIRTAYERKRAEVRLNYLNDVQRTKQRYVARSSSTTEETISNRQKNRFEVVTTFEREPDSQQSFSQETHGYNYNDNSLMNYYSNESDVYYRPAIRS